MARTKLALSSAVNVGVGSLVIWEEETAPVDRVHGVKRCGVKLATPLVAARCTWPWRLVQDSLEVEATRVTLRMAGVAPECTCTWGGSCKCSQ